MIAEPGAMTHGKERCSTIRGVERRSDWFRPNLCRGPRVSDHNEGVVTTAPRPDDMMACDDNEHALRGRTRLDAEETPPDPEAERGEETSDNHVVKTAANTLPSSQ